MDIVLVLVGVFVSGLCEYLSAALLDLRQSVLQTMAEEGSIIGERFQRAYEDVEETALAISIIDVIAILMATVFLSVVLFDNGGRLIISVTALAIGVGAFKVVCATIGSRYAEHALGFTSVVLVGVRILASPFIALHSTMMRVTQHGTDEEEAREELEAFVETARDEGALDPSEYRIMTNIMRLSSIEVGDVMTPRTVVFSCPSTMTIEEIVKLPELQTYSRFPIYDKTDLDSVSGYVITKDVLRAALAGRQAVELVKLKREVDFIPENITLEKALELFLQKRQHILMVVDEHGGVEGMITMEDVLESMLGVEIVDEVDHVVDLRALAKQRRDRRIRN
ncbi:MAG: CBS domain-containing protein [Ignavibacteria bacterium]|nr:CBS domain-containing protein [Ignavibacteria bacterium]